MQHFLVKKYKEYRGVIMKESDINSLEELFNYYKGSIYSFIYKSVFDKNIADELTQETFYHACMSIHKFKNKSSVKTWLYSIARNRMLKYYKSKEKDNFLIEDIEVYNSSIDPLEILIKKENNKLVYKALSIMDINYSTVLVLRDIEGLSYKDIAVITQINHNTLRSIYHRAKTQFIRYYLDLKGGGKGGM